MEPTQEPVTPKVRLIFHQTIEISEVHGGEWYFKFSGALELWKLPGEQQVFEPGDRIKITMEREDVKMDNPGIL